MPLVKKHIGRYSVMENAVGDFERLLASHVRESGFEYAAQYIETFGKNLNPWFWDGMDDYTEEFYKRCVEEKHPWDYYVDPPGPNIDL